VLRWQKRQLGLHFLQQEPFFEVFREPTEPVEQQQQQQRPPERRQPALEAAIQSPLDILRTLNTAAPASAAPPTQYYSKFGELMEF